ncbi:MAG TPA: glycosyltransferase [Candidatus Omnitrophota bacterium]|nr:glycosyltransferase [Candidatus Omnitrophota bacterium]
MSEPLISVVMPTFNHAAFIKEAIDSVLGQTHRNLELIIVDNFSKDKTEQIVRSVPDQRIRYYQFANKGIIAASRNFGIKQAKGDFIAFLDSDDMWFPEKLEKQTELLLKDGSYGLCFCKLQIKSPDLTEDGSIRGPKINDRCGSLYKRLTKNNFICSSSVIVRSAILNKVGYFDENEEIVTAEDFDLWLRILRLSGGVFLDEVQGVYRKHVVNESSKYSRLEKALAVIDKHTNNGWITQREANQAKANFYFHVGYDEIESNATRARSYFRKAMQLDPTNIKMLAVCSAGVLLTLVPTFSRWLKRRRLDKKLAYILMNPQNI